MPKFLRSSSHQPAPPPRPFTIPRPKVRPSSESPPLQIESIGNSSPAAATLRVFTSPVPPQRDDQPFEPHIRRFQTYEGTWQSDSEDEALTAEEREECENAFRLEEAQVARDASRFAALHPAFGHEVLPQHAHLLNQMQEI